MNDRATDFDFKRTGLAGLAVVLSKGSDCEHGCFVQAVCVDLDRMAKPVSIEIGNRASSHWAQSSIFDNFRQILSP